MLPVTSFVEEEGTLTNSSRCIQWKWKAADPYGQSRTDIEILADLFLRIRKLYEEEGGTGAEPLMAIDWSYADPAQPSPDELLQELNGKALADVRDAEGKVIRKAGEQLAQLRRDAGRRLDRRRPCGSTPASTGRTATSRSGASNERPVGPRRLRQLGLRLAGQPPHPVQPRFGRPPGQALERGGRSTCTGTAQRWTGPDVPDYVADDPARPGDRPLHHERGGRLAPVGPRP